ncbi:PhzF family phenazine biosynthesis protein [Streptomyces sp. NPDC058268]|uniref:PhzF family phenazine biosynthesis protein n=1 Tax=Streptomyces sp. NPDC058268 TaxID=3346413 RepID=UPI0036E13FF5
MARTRPAHSALEQQLSYALCDVFTSRPLAGNQLAVVWEGELLNEARMQALARELNLSETVYVFPAQEGGDARLRLYSTVVEVPFAGHPILGTAALLADRRDLHGEHLLRLETARGIVPVTVQRTAPGRYTAWMDQPLPEIRDFDRAEELLGVLGVERALLPVQVYDAGIPHLYVMAETVEAVAQIVPNFPELGRIAGNCRINVFAGQGDTFTTRMFSPFDFVPEDPACGSAAGPLAAHLVRHGIIDSGREVTLSQGANVGRPSVLYAMASVKDGRIGEIRVGGGVCLIGEGRLTLPPLAEPGSTG